MELGNIIYAETVTKLVSHLDRERAAVAGELEAKAGPYISRIDKAISDELDLYIESRFHDPLEYAMGGGKRVRPLILLLSAEALGCRDGKLMDAAVAVELLHTESIIHDDIIDEDVTRRGRMAFHVKYGFSTSLLTADFVFAMILAMAARYKDRRVAAAISDSALKMAEGEFSELTIDPEAYKLTWDEYIRIISEKTAVLFETSSKLGALIAGGSDKEVTALSDFGKCLGIAYQLRDDLLDWGEEDKIARALLKGSRESEVTEKMTKLSEHYAEKARKELNFLPDSEARQFLDDMTKFTVERNR